MYFTLNAGLVKTFLEDIGGINVFKRRQAATS